jgi:hypothetical protein
MGFPTSFPKWNDKGFNSKNTQELEIKMEYSGKAIEANLYIDSTDGDYSRVIPLSTLGDTDKRSVELLFAIDTSGSMRVDLATAASACSTFMTDLKAALPTIVEVKFGVHVHSDTGYGEWFGFNDVDTPKVKASCNAATIARPSSQSNPGTGFPTCTTVLTTDSSKVKNILNSQ